MWQESGMGGESPGLTFCGLGLLFWQKPLEAQLLQWLSSRPACLWTMVCPCSPHYCSSSCRVGGPQLTSGPHIHCLLGWAESPGCQDLGPVFSPHIYPSVYPSIHPSISPSIHPPIQVPTQCRALCWVLRHRLKKLAWFLIAECPCSVRSGGQTEHD